MTRIKVNIKEFTKKLLIDLKIEEWKVREILKLLGYSSGYIRNIMSEVKKELGNSSSQSDVTK